MPGASPWTLCYWRTTGRNYFQLATHFELAKRLHYLSPETIHEVEAQLEHTGQLLHGLARSLRTRRAITVAGWLALLVGLEFGRAIVPGAGDLLARSLLSF